MSAEAITEIRSALTDLYRAVSSIARQVNAHSVADELAGVKQSIAALNRLGEHAAHQATNSQEKQA